jgi:hypothetical protein
MEKLMAWRLCLITGTLLSLAVSSCTRSPGDTRMALELAVAADSQHALEHRMNAASKLGAGDRRKLRELLIAELPGDWDKKTLDAIEVLGVVGNQETIEFLERLDSEPTESTGKFHGAIERAIQAIKQRGQP